MKRRYFVIDTEKCIGCFNCVHACKDEHLSNDWSPISAPLAVHGQAWISVTEYVRGQHPMVDVTYLVEPCSHCDKPICIPNGQGAIYRRDDGTVIIDPDKARGKGDLSSACPYGKISYDPDQEISQKCTFCAHLLDESWEQTRCTQACPLGAISARYCEPEVMADEVERDALALAHPELAFTSPSVYYRNLRRLNSMFLGGSVVRQEAGRETCFVGCSVVLLTEVGSLVATQDTDEWGEFKFDGLRPGTYVISAKAEGFAPLESTVVLSYDHGSLYLGILKFEEMR